MHLIRNAMDHGIESEEERVLKGKNIRGKIALEAKEAGGEVIITVTDDGRGLEKTKILKKARERGLTNKPDNDYTDREIFSFILLPGFSTNDNVTEYSGRGVGMDVVKKNIEQVGGSVFIDSKIGAGTSIMIKIPLTLAIVDGMEISVGKSIYTIPTTSIKQSFKPDKRDLIENAEGTEMIMIRGNCYPIIRVHSLFNVETPVQNLWDGIIVMIEGEEKSACLFVDRLIGEQQVVVKPLPSYLLKYSVKKRGIAGCTILGDGTISLILDVGEIINRVI
jgi:two-component system chemotaxis sensor kinase CheA